MTRDQYLALVAACDRVLRDPDAPPAVTAIPWLHVIREHPVFLARYTAVFRKPSAVRDAADRLKQRLAAIRQKQRAPAPRGPASSGPADVLFVSHLLNEGGLDSADDFYFGSVPGALRDAGSRVCVALIDHTAGGAGTKGTPAPGRVALSQRLAPRDEREIGEALSGAARFLRRSARRTSGLDARVRTCASWFAVGPEARTAMRVARQIESLVRQCRPALVITTHEGHAWERLVFAAARRAHPSVKVAAYHATALFALQHAMTRPLHARYNPDFILTAGSITAGVLRSRPGLAGVDIAVLGSNRHFRPDAFDRSVPKPACVVVPEGYPSEVRILFKFAVDAARTDPGIEWLLRLHPQMSFDEIRRELGALPSNVTLSTRTLGDDLASASWALYRGSSAAIQALAAGLRPIYVAEREPFTIDPMFSLDRWRVTVNTPEEAVRIVRGDLAQPAALAEERAAAVSYAERYFEPLDPAVLVRKLREAVAS